MRSLEDNDRRRWDVFVGKASYGVVMLMFAERGTDRVKSHAMPQDNLLDAERTLAALSDAELRTYLHQADEVGGPLAPSS